MIHLRDIQIRDPFILREGRAYYLFGSTDKDIWHSPGVGFDVYHSDGDLARFEGPYPAFRPPESFWATYNYWAPEVYAYGGGYYMFATFKPDHGRRGTAVLRADHPLGPFTPWSAGPVTPHEWECLDGTLYVDDSGRPWMIFCHEWKQIGDGRICAMPMSHDLKSADGSAIPLFHASEAGWSKPLTGRPPNSHVTDGPYPYRAKNGALLILWSSFGESGKYCIGVAKSKNGSVTGPWEQEQSPIYATDGGHGMLFTTPEDKLYLAIHTPNKTPGERAVFLEIKERDGVLSLGEDLIF